MSCGVGQLASDQKTEGLKDANSIWLKTAEDTMRGVDTKKLEKEQQLRQKKQDKKVQIIAFFWIAVFRIRINLIRIRIRIQHFWLNTGPDTGFWWPKIGKNLQLKKKILDKKLQFTYP